MSGPYTRKTAFYWRGIGADKKYTKGICYAKNNDDLRKQLLKKHILLCHSRKKLFGNNLSSKQISFILGQLLTFLRAGMPILKSLEMICDNEKSRQVACKIEDIKNKIETGGKLSDSLAFQTSPKENVMLEILAVGERSGHLVTVLERLIQQREQEEDIRNQLKRAVTYPLFLIITAITVMVVLMLWVVPEFKQVYENMETALPAYTMNTIMVSNMLKDHGITIIVGLFLLGGFLTVLKNTVPYIGWLFAKLQLRIPITGSLLTIYFCRHFASNMKLVYQSGMPLEESLRWFSKSGIHPVYCAALKNIQQNINRGQSLNQAIKQSKFFPIFFYQIIQAGEHSGALEQALHKIEQHYDEKLKNRINTMIQLIEPILITGIAVCAGWLMMTIYLPIFNLGFIL